MKYVEASKFGGPEVLKVIDKENTKTGRGLAACRGASCRSQLCRRDCVLWILSSSHESDVCLGVRSCWCCQGGWEGLQTVSTQRGSRSSKQIDTNNLDGPEKGLYLGGYLRTGWRHAPDLVIPGKGRPSARRSSRSPKGRIGIPVWKREKKQR
jgi:hypothetical protein